MFITLHPDSFDVIEGDLTICFIYSAELINRIDFKVFVHLFDAEGLDTCEAESAAESVRIGNALQSIAEHGHAAVGGLVSGDFHTVLVSCPRAAVAPVDDSVFALDADERTAGNVPGMGEHVDDFDIFSGLEIESNGVESFDTLSCAVHFGSHFHGGGVGVKGFSGEEERDVQIMSERVVDGGVKDGLTVAVLDTGPVVACVVDIGAGPDSGDDDFLYFSDFA